MHSFDCLHFSPFSKQIYTVITVSVYPYSLQLINEDSDAMCKIPWNFPYIMFHICRPDIGCKFMCSVLEITLALSENIIVFIGAWNFHPIGTDLIFLLNSVLFDAIFNEMDPHEGSSIKRLCLTSLCPWWTLLCSKGMLGKRAVQGESIDHECWS